MSISKLKYLHFLHFKGSFFFLILCFSEHVYFQAPRATGAPSDCISLQASVQRQDEKPQAYGMLPVGAKLLATLASPSCLEKHLVSRCSV